MIDPKFQPNPVVPKPKLPKATVINLNPNYKKTEQISSDSNRIIVSVQKSEASTEPRKQFVGEKNTALFDFKKLIDAGLEQSKNIFQNTTEAFKNVENKIQSRFKNEIIKAGKENPKKPPLEKKRLFEAPKLTPKKTILRPQNEIKTTKHLGAQILVILGCSVGIIGALTVLVSFQSILTLFAADLKTIQWILVLFFLVSSVFTLYSENLIKAWGAKIVFFDGLILMILGLLIAIFSPSLIFFILGVSVLFGLGFVMVFRVASQLFFYNSGYFRQGRSNILFSKTIVATSIISLLFSGLLPFFLGFKWALALDCILAVLTIFNLNRICEIKEKTTKIKIPYLDIMLFTIANLFISFGIVESLYFGWFAVKNPFEVLGNVYNPKISISFISLLVGLFILVFRNFVNKKSSLSIKFIFSTILEFIKSGFLGGLVSLFVFGILFFVGYGTKSNLIQISLGILPLFFGFLISTFLVKNLSQKVSCKNSKLLGLIIYIIGLIMLYFTIAVNISAINLISPFLLIGLGAGIFQLSFRYDSVLENGFNFDYSKFISVIFFGLAFFWSFSSSNFNLTAADNLIPDNLKPDLFATINTAKNLTACKIEPYNQNNVDELEANKIRRAICENFTNSIVEGSRTVITLAAVISVLCFFVVISEKED